MPKAGEILVVEDDPGLRALLGDCCGEVCRAATFVGDGRGALDHLAGHPCALMVLDYQLPDMTAAELVDAVRRRLGTAPPFVVMTGVGNEQVAVDMMRKGARDYLVKNAQFLPAFSTVLGRVLREIETERDLLCATEALKEREELFRLFMEYSPYYVFIKDSHTRAVELSRNYEAMLGRPLDQILGRTMEDLFPSEMAKAMIADDQRVLREGKPIVVVEELGGRIYETQKFPILRNGKPELLAGFTMDITERRRTEAALRDSEERYRRLFTTGNDAVFVHERLSTGLPGPFVEVNDVACRRLGYTREEMVGKPPMEIDDPATHAGIPAAMERLQVDGHAIWEGIHVAKDGRRIPVEISAQQFELGGRPMLLSVVRDISERKQAAERESALREKLERAARMESLGVLAGGVAHDLNNILGPLVALPELIEEYLAAHVEPSEPELADMIDAVRSMQSSAQRAAAVVSDLVVMGRRGQFRAVPVDLNEVVAKMVASRQVQAMRARRPDVVLSTRLAEQELWCLGSESRLVRVLLNLVGNAFEAIDGKGDVVVRTFPAGLTESKAGYETIPPGAYVGVEVVDTGGGMDAATMSRIFEPFFTTKAAGERSGSGLGLSVVHGLVRDHGGFMDLRSAVGRGTAFTVYIPQTEKGAGGDPAGETAAPGGGERILVVDDEPGQLANARLLLRKLGYQVEVASGGQDAVDLFEQARRAGGSSPFDLVVMDMIMRPMDGLTACREILARFPGQRICVASGHASEVAAAEARALGAVWLPKPYQYRELAHAVRSRLDQPAPSAS